MQITPENIIYKFEKHGIPSYGLCLDFYPSHNLIRALTYRFQIEFAVMFSITNRRYYLYSGDHNSVDLPVSDDEILLNHSHPGGTPHPSINDISWLRAAQKQKSPQVKSIILPRGKRRVTFDIHTPTS